MKSMAGCPGLTQSKVNLRSPGSQSDTGLECWALDVEWLDQNYDSALGRQLHCDPVQILQRSWATAL